MKNLVLLLSIIIVCVVAGLAFAEFRWRARTNAAVSALMDGVDASLPARFSTAELDGLPAPVARYFRAVLKDGQPLAHHVWLRQTGEFLAKPDENGWRPFEASQDFVTEPAGFVWDARIRMAPGMRIRVRDACVNGTGSMFVAILGLFTVVRMENTPDMGTASLMRYLAEASWFPTARLPSAGVVWTAIDDSTARASLTVRTTTATLDFHFRPDGLIERVFAQRPRAVSDSSVLTKWEGRWTKWEERNGALIPVAGEVAWLLPEGRQAYWRGRITDIVYDRNEEALWTRRN